MTTPARELRDALAEALWRSMRVLPSAAIKDTPEAVRRGIRAWLPEADALLASLPSVKLKMGWEE